MLGAEGIWALTSQTSPETLQLKDVSPDTSLPQTAGAGCLTSGLERAEIGWRDLAQGKPLNFETKSCLLLCFKTKCV